MNITSHLIGILYGIQRPSVQYRKDITTLPRVILNCNPFMGNIVRNKAWHLPNKYLITNKEKEISFKPIHRFYLCKDYLKPRIKSEVEEKCFYKQCPETVVHLLWYCPDLRRFWQSIKNFICDNFDAETVLFWRVVVFGFLRDNAHRKAHAYIIDFILLMAKYYIHCCNFTNRKPQFVAIYWRDQAVQSI